MTNNPHQPQPLLTGNRDMSKKKKPDEAGLRVARRYAGWHIGDETWADNIIHAYLNPEQVNAELDADDVPQRTGVFRW